MEEKVLTILSQEYLKCNKCGKNIVDIVEIENSDNQYGYEFKYRVNKCPHCGGKSNLSSAFTRKTIFNSTSEKYDINIVDQPEQDNEMICILELKWLLT